MGIVRQTYYRFCWVAKRNILYYKARSCLCIHAFIIHDETRLSFYFGSITSTCYWKRIILKSFLKYFVNIFPSHKKYVIECIISIFNLKILNFYIVIY